MLSRLPVAIIQSWYQREGYVESMADFIQKDEVTVELGKGGVKSLLAVLVSFMSEHIETLEEIDMEYKELDLESGVENWGRVTALGCTSTFITDLAYPVIEAYCYSNDTIHKRE